MSRPQGRLDRSVFPAQAPESDGWRITFADTGVDSSIGERLGAAKGYLDGESVFLANYADGLTDFPLAKLIDSLQGDKVGIFLCVRPSLTYHFVKTRPDGTVTEIAAATRWVCA